MIKALSFKYEERIVAVAKQNRSMMCRKQRMENAGFSSGTADVGRQQNSTVEMLKYRKPRILYLAKLYFKNKSEKKVRLKKL